MWPNQIKPIEAGPARAAEKQKEIMRDGRLLYTGHGNNSRDIFVQFRFMLLGDKALSPGDSEDHLNVDL